MKKDTEQAFKLVKSVPSDEGQPIHPFDIPAGIYGLILEKQENNMYYVQFTLPTTSIYGYNWVYATVKSDTFELVDDPELAEETQDIPTITLENC